MKQSSRPPAVQEPVPTAEELAIKIEQMRNEIQKLKIGLEQLNKRIAFMTESLFPV